MPVMLHGGQERKGRREPPFFLVCVTGWYPASFFSVAWISMGGIRWVGFDGDDTLWKSEDYYRAAEVEFEAIIGQYIDLSDVRTLQHLLEVERRNLRIFGYGAKGMTLSMIESSIQLTGERISASDIHRVIEIGRATLQHPVELIDGIRDAVEAIAADHEIVLITKGDLFHQEHRSRACRRRAKLLKSLKMRDRKGRRRLSKPSLCGPVRSDVVFSCLGSAPITGAA